MRERLSRLDLRLDYLKAHPGATAIETDAYIERVIAEESMRRPDAGRRKGKESEKRAERLFWKYREVIGVRPAGKYDDRYRGIDVWVTCMNTFKAEEVSVPVQVKSSSRGVDESVEIMTSMLATHADAYRFIIDMGRHRKDSLVLDEIQDRFARELGIPLTIITE